MKLTLVVASSFGETVLVRFRPPVDAFHLTHYSFPEGSCVPEVDQREAASELLRKETGLSIPAREWEPLAKQDGVVMFATLAELSTRTLLPQHYEAVLGDALAGSAWQNKSRYPRGFLSLLGLARDRLPTRT